MSTRATYQFNTQYEGKHTFYIHHDGYEAGAAMYFLNMYQYKEPSKGGMGAKFLRANTNAELTSSHESHADTEYRYTVDKDGILKAEKIVYTNVNSYTDDFSSEWKIIFVGHYTEFINKYIDTGYLEEHEHYEYIYKIDSNEYGTARSNYYTESELNLLIDEAVNKARDYECRFPEHKGNIHSNYSEVYNLQERMKTLQTLKKALAE